MKKFYYPLKPALSLFLFFSLFVLWANNVKAEVVEESDCLDVADPSGDLKISSATSVTVEAPDRADILWAKLSASDNGWEFTATMAKPLSPTFDKNERADLLLEFDINKKVEDNYWRITDRRAGADLHYVLFSTGSSTEPWKLDFYRYNVGTYKWHKLSTSSTYELLGSEIKLKIPKAEIPLDADFNWRTASYVGSKSWSAFDYAPDKTEEATKCGYLPVPPEPDLNEPKMSKNIIKADKKMNLVFESVADYILGASVLLVVIAAGYAFLDRKKNDE